MCVCVTFFPFGLCPERAVGTLPSLYYYEYLFEGGFVNELLNDYSFFGAANLCCIALCFTIYDIFEQEFPYFLLLGE